MRARGLTRGMRVLLRTHVSGGGSSSSINIQNHKNNGKSRVLGDALQLRDFLRNGGKESEVPILEPTSLMPLNESFFIETYGCAMNTSDTEIIRSILKGAGCEEVTSIESASVVLTNTCAIREGAEKKVFDRLNYFQSIRNKNKLAGKTKGRRHSPLVGVLGCMAERLKGKLLEEDGVDFVVGPDAYRDLPRLLSSVSNSTAQKEANVQLSLDETYADISPVRESSSASAFVSIMRGCNNMCSFCVVPFTRGRERSRDMASILSEIQKLAHEGGVREIVLLGQNVNGYHDTSAESAQLYPSNTSYTPTPGFVPLYNSKKKSQAGARFADLLGEVAKIHPEMRVRFTSPHPKDFPPEVLQVIAEMPNICKSIHLPLQSGSTNVLARMRRGYTSEAFYSLVEEARRIIPNVTISTDVISGFCGETEEEHEETVAMMKKVEFDQAFMFAYSLRDKTHAAHTMEDNVPEKEKIARLQQVIDSFKVGIRRKNRATELGKLRLVLVEGPAKKSTPQLELLTGRTDGNKRVVFPAMPILSNFSLIKNATSSNNDNDNNHNNNSNNNEAARMFQQSIREVDDLLSSTDLSLPSNPSFPTSTPSMTPLPNANQVTPESLLRDRLLDLQKLPGMETINGTCDTLVGKYVVVKVTMANGPTLRGIPIAVSTLQESAHLG